MGPPGYLCTVGCVNFVTNQITFRAQPCRCTAATATKNGLENHTTARTGLLTARTASVLERKKPRESYWLLGGERFRFTKRDMLGFGTGLSLILPAANRQAFCRNSTNAVIEACRSHVPQRPAVPLDRRTITRIHCLGLCSRCHRPARGRKPRQAAVSHRQRRSCGAPGSAKSVAAGPAEGAP